jgi:hypothetical protein
MNPSTGMPRVWDRWKDAEHLALVATFEDSSTCTRVKQFCRNLASELGARCKITQHVWTLSTLRMQELQEIAAGEAATADLIIIAARLAESVPDELKHWIEKWMHQRGNRTIVLLALLDRPHDGTVNPIRTYLQEVADRGGLELLIKLEEPA